MKKLLLVLTVALYVAVSFGQSASTDWTDVPLTGTDAFNVDAEYRYKRSGPDYWYYPKQISAQTLVSNESTGPQIFYVSAANKSAYLFNGVFSGTVTRLQKRTVPWTDTPISGTDAFDPDYEYRFKMNVPSA